MSMKPIGVDTNQLVLEKHHKQVIYDQVHPKIRFEVARHLLPNFTVSSPKELSKKSKRERGEYRRRRGHAWDFFVLVNRLFHFENDHSSVNSKNAFFPEERIQPLQSSSEHMFRFDYTIPTPLAEKLLSTILQHLCGRSAKSFASAVPI